IPPDERLAYVTNPDNQQVLGRLMSARGPGGVDLCDQPWLEPDTTMPIGMSGIYDGVDVDEGRHAPGCGATDLTSPDGRTGIDNALSRVWACTAQKRGDGYMPVYEVGLMTAGEFTILIQIS